MDPKQYFKQMLEFNKEVFDNASKTMSFFQNASEQYIVRFLNNASWIPAENKKAFNEWSNDLKKYNQNLKDSIDENYTKAIEYLDSFQTQNVPEDKTK